jgi:dephospho-CoA kinase
MVFLVGLTGGIASGKSTVSKLFASYGAATLDADQVAREVVTPGSDGLSAVVRQFGSSILKETGELDREELGKIVFADEGKRKALEAILHPLIRTRTYQLIAESKSPVVVYAVPLLVEASVDYPFDMILTVEAGSEEQVNRLVKSRGLSVQEAASRVSSQATRAERAERADFVIDSSGTLAQLEAQVEVLWTRILQAAKEKSG